MLGNISIRIFSEKAKLKDEKISKFKIILPTITNTVFHIQSMECSGMIK